MPRHVPTRTRELPLALALLGVLVILLAISTQRAGAGPGSAKASSVPSTGALASPSGGVGAVRSGGSGPFPGLPIGLDDRGWVAEIGVQRWLAGSLAGRVLVLPPDEIALMASATTVVSVRYGKGGRTSTVRIRELAGGRLRVSVDRPGTVSSAVLAGGNVYITGDAGTGGGSDPGVQAISLDDGSVRDIIAPGPAPADAPGPVTRTQLRLDSAGQTLGSPLCSGDVCTVDVIDLAEGTRTTPIRNAHGFLVALTNRAIYLVDDTSTSIDAFDAVSGALRWHLGGRQFGGLLPTSDGTRVLLAYLSSGGSRPPAFTLAAADAGTGALEVLLQQAADADVPTFYPNLSGDRFAVIAGGTLGELLGGARRRAGLTLIDLRSGTSLVDALTINAP